MGRRLGRAREAFEAEFAALLDAVNKLMDKVASGFALAEVLFLEANAYAPAKTLCENDKEESSIDQMSGYDDNANRPEMSWFNWPIKQSQLGGDTCRCLPTRPWHVL
jgi:hypothetical protein